MKQNVIAAQDVVHGVRKNYANVCSAKENKQKI